MPAFKLLSILILFLCSMKSYAQSEESVGSPFPAPLSPTRSYKFEISGGKGAKAEKNLLGTLKFHEQKESVRLEFEGRGLDKGQYQIVKTESCETLRRRLLSNKPMPADSSLFTFETEYGHISTEKNLNGQKLADLELETTMLAIVKVEKKGNRFVSCAQ